MLDTNVLLAILLAPLRLPETTRADLSDSANMVWFSSASLLEIAVKVSLGKANFDFWPEDIHALALETHFTELPITATHIPTRWRDCLGTTETPLTVCWWHRPWRCLPFC